MLQQTRTLLAMIVIGLALFNLLFSNLNLFPFLLIAVAALMLVVGIIEFQKKKIAFGIVLIIITAFLIFVAIQGFLIG
ncbi:DUF3953 domain-containing protein [Virgibacillus oceani]